MDLTVKLLGTHSGRDRVLRTLSYTTKFLSGICRPNGRNAEKFAIISAQMSQCRTILRLFDDLPMLQYTLSYGLGKKEEGAFIRLLNVVINLVDQVYYPLEHIAWASEKKLIGIKDSSGWWNASTSMWAISLYLNIIKTLRSLFILNHKKAALMKSNSSTVQMKELQKVQVMEALSLIAYTCDFCNALHWIEMDFRFVKDLKQWQVGLLGIVSSLIGAYKMIQNARKN